MLIGRQVSWLGNGYDKSMGHDGYGMTECPQICGSHHYCNVSKDTFTVGETASGYKGILNTNIKLHDIPYLKKIYESRMRERWDFVHVLCP